MIILGSAGSVILLIIVVYWIRCCLHRRKDKQQLEKVVVEPEDVEMLKPMMKAPPESLEHIVMLPETIVNHYASPRPKKLYIETASIGSQPTVLSVNSPKDQKLLHRFPSSVFSTSADSVSSLLSLRTDFSNSVASSSAEEPATCQLVSPESLKALAIHEHSELPPLVIPASIASSAVEMQETSRTRCDCFSPPANPALGDLEEKRLAMAACPICSKKLFSLPPPRTTSNKYGSLSIRLANATSQSSPNARKACSDKVEQTIESYSHIIDSRLNQEDSLR